jgi:hypothetical protein
MEAAQAEIIKSYGKSFLNPNFVNKVKEHRKRTGDSPNGYVASYGQYR